MNRLFMFGCSFTKYLWPTWANIIEHDSETTAEIWGWGGRGNVAISYNILEAHLKRKFDVEDKIIVNWSFWSREDRYNNSWSDKGNVLVSAASDWSPENDCMKNMSAIIYANTLANINYQSHAGDYNFNLSAVDTLKFKYLIDAMPTKNTFDLDTNSSFQKHLMEDGHPDVCCHINHAQKVSVAVFDRPLKQSTVDYYTTIHHDIVAMLEQNASFSENYKKTTWPERREFFGKVLGTDFYKNRQIGI